jgi:hypothetical protein
MTIALLYYTRSYDVPIYISINLFKILIQTSFILGKGVIGLNFPGCPATFQQEFQPFGQVNQKRERERESDIDR